VNEWLVGALGALALLFPTLLLTMTGALLDRIIAMQLASTIGTLALLLLAQGFGRDVYFDLAVVTAFLSFIGTLFYLRLVESWL
jgi:multicomponent Na+:H+ antiporter subunit F